MAEQRKQESPGEKSEYNRCEIPYGEWLSFLDSFSRQHEDWLVTLEVLENQGGTRVEAENLKLEGITPEHSEDHHRISIAMGKAPDDHLTHFVSDPKRLLLLESRSGGHVGLEIEGADGSRTLVRFLGPAKPENLDEVAA